MELRSKRKGAYLIDDEPWEVVERRCCGVFLYKVPAGWSAGSDYCP